MTAPEHNRTLGILFAVYTGLQVLGLILAIVVLIFTFGIIAQSAPPGDEVPMAFISVVIFVAFGISILLLIPVAMATISLLRSKPNGRFWGIVGSIVALLSFPLGTALGIYGLWFFFSDEGRGYYLGHPTNTALSQPEPHAWR